MYVCTQVLAAKITVYTHATVHCYEYTEYTADMTKLLASCVYKIMFVSCSSMYLRN